MRSRQGSDSVEDRSLFGWELRLVASDRLHLLLQMPRNVMKDTVVGGTRGSRIEYQLVVELCGDGMRRHVIEIGAPFREPGIEDGGVEDGNCLLMIW